MPASSAPAVALVPAVDKRIAPHDVVGTIRNGWGLRTADLVTTDDLVAWTGKVLADELRAAGVRVVEAGPGIPQLSAELRRVHAESYRDYSGDIILRARLRVEDSVRYDSLVRGKSSADPQGEATESAIATTLNTTMQKAARKLAGRIAKILSEGSSPAAPPAPLAPGVAAVPTGARPSSAAVPVEVAPAPNAPAVAALPGEVPPAPADVAPAPSAPAVAAVPPEVRPAPAAVPAEVAPAPSAPECTAVPAEARPASAAVAAEEAASPIAPRVSGVSSEVVAAPAPAPKDPAPAAPPGSVDLYLAAGHDFGFTRHAEAIFEDGSRRSIRVNGGSFLAIGTNLLKVSEGRLSTRLAFGFKYQSVSAKNGDLTYLAIPIEAVEQLNLGPVRLGAGLTLSLHSRFSGKGLIALAGEQRFQPSLGGLFEARYVFRFGGSPGLGLGVGPRFLWQKFQSLHDLRYRQANAAGFMIDCTL